LITSLFFGLDQGTNDSSTCYDNLIGSTKIRPVFMEFQFCLSSVELTVFLQAYFWWINITLRRRWITAFIMMGGYVAIGMGISFHHICIPQELK